MSEPTEDHGEEDPEFWTVAAWNGTGTALVFHSREAYEKMIADYEDFRVAHSLPWVHGKAGADGEVVLAMWDKGLRPWTVALGPTQDIISVRAKPLHHITLQLVSARYKSGAPRLLEIWAEDDHRAAWYARDIFILAPDPSLGLINDVDFGMEDAGTKERTEAVVQAIEDAATAPPAIPPVVIPGFGKVVDVKDL